MTTTKIRAFAVLANALVEERISPSEFVEICLPLYKYYADPFPSEEHYELATELFYAADDYVPAGGPREAGDLDDVQLRERVGRLLVRMMQMAGW